VPTLVAQVNDLVQAVPGYVHDLTHGRGPLGFLETKYHVVERARDAVSGSASGVIGGGAQALVSFTSGVVSGVAATVTIGFLTFFMLVEGPTWMDRAYGLMRPPSERRWRRLGSEVRRVVGGYVTGNLLISLIAGSAATVVLLALSVPFAAALGLVVFVLDLLPMVGATLAAIILTAAAFSTSTTAAIIVLAYFIVYQQVENHLLQPLVYGRAVQLSPLTTLIAILIGAELAGVFGALAAIPVAGSIRAVVEDWQRQRAAASPVA
jgi:predicted PurR-regulated permease PerM